MTPNILLTALLTKISREAHPLIDSNGQIYAVLAGRPSDSTYLADAYSAFEAIVQEGSTAQFRPGEIHHRRGAFPALAVGISHGNGQTAPTKLQNGVHTEMLNRLLGHSAI